MVSKWRILHWGHRKRPYFFLIPVLKLHFSRERNTTIINDLVLSTAVTSFKIVMSSKTNIGSKTNFKIPWNPLRQYPAVPSCIWYDFALLSRNRIFNINVNNFLAHLRNTKWSKKLLYINWLKHNLSFRSVGRNILFVTEASRYRAIAAERIVPVIRPYCWTNW